jgi:hypothetical protein
VAIAATAYAFPGTFAHVVKSAKLAHLGRPQRPPVSAAFFAPGSPMPSVHVPGPVWPLLRLGSTPLPPPSPQRDGAIGSGSFSRVPVYSAPTVFNSNTALKSH